MVELSAAARNGDSGGPIFNSRGELAGVLFGAASGRTTGSYCGRVRWFLGPIIDDFRRADALWIAQHPPGGSTLQVAESAGLPVSVGPALPRVSSDLPPGGPMPARPAQGAAAPSPVTAAIGSPQPLATTPPGTGAQPMAAAPLGLPPTVAPAVASEAPGPQRSTRLDQIKTVLAAIGGFLLLVHALRLLGSLGGK